MLLNSKKLHFFFNRLTPPTCKNKVGLHLEPDFHQVHWSSHAHGNKARHHAGQRQVQYAGGVLPVTIAKLANDPLRVAEAAKHHRIVESNAGQREGEAFEKSRNLAGAEEWGNFSIQESCPAGKEVILHVKWNLEELDMFFCFFPP